MLRIPPNEFKRLYAEVTDMIATYAIQYGTRPQYIRSRRKTKAVAEVRRHIAKILFVQYKLPVTLIGKLLHVDHSTISLYVKGYQQCSNVKSVEKSLSQNKQ